MADFRSANVLGLQPPVLKQNMPTQVWGADVGDPTTPILVATPISDGGVMCVGTTDVVEASRWNWKHSGPGATVMGAVIDITFDIVEPPSSFVQSLFGDAYNFGTTNVTILGDGTGADFTIGDPNCSRDIATYGSGSIIIGTSLQRLIATGVNSTQNVRLTLTLQMEWLGIRWWDHTELGGDSFMGGFAMKLTGLVEPEDGYEWEEAENFDPRTVEWFSNWKVFEVEELADWDLNTIPLGGPAEVWGAGTGEVVGTADCFFFFGIDDPDDAGSTPIQGYDFHTEGGGGLVNIVINTMEVRFPTVLGSIPAL